MGLDSVIAALRAALATSPDDHAVRRHLAGVLLDAGRPEEALTEAALVLRTRPNDVEAQRLAADAADALADLRSALVNDRVDDAKPVEDGRGETDVRPALSDVPDTVDELVADWQQSEPIGEPRRRRRGRPVVALSDVGGLDEVKRRLDVSILAPLRRSALRMRLGTSLRGGVLLWGPPGCGKTLLARALAGELGKSFREVGLAEMLDIHLGSPESHVQSVFEAARLRRPCTLFFDEIDAIGGRRSRMSGAWTRGAVHQLLLELDGMDSDNDGLFVLAATNRPWDLDPALLRPGRFDRPLLVPPPDATDRESVLRLHLRGRSVERLDLSRLAQRTKGYSAADLALVCEVAAETAASADPNAGVPSLITQQHLTAAVLRVAPSMGEWMQTARNYATYSNESGLMDQLKPYLGRRRDR